MTQRIPLPDDAWAEIKEPKELTNRERKFLRRQSIAVLPLQAKLVEAGLGPSDVSAEGQVSDVATVKLFEMLGADNLDLLESIQSAAIVTYTLGWGYKDETHPAPTMETVDDMPGFLYDALAKATFGLGDGTVDFGVDGAPDPSSPTVPSIA